MCTWCSREGADKGSCSWPLTAAHWPRTDIQLGRHISRRPACATTSPSSDMLYTYTLQWLTIYAQIPLCSTRPNTIPYLNFALWHKKIWCYAQVLSSINSCRTCRSLYATRLDVHCMFNVHATTNHWAALARVMHSSYIVIIDGH